MSDKVEALLSAAEDGDLDKVIEQLDIEKVHIDSKGGYWRETALHKAAIFRRVAVCDYLIKKGCDVNATDKYRETALHKAADKGHAEICSLLLKYGCDVNVISDLGQTALHRAAWRGHSQICSLLIDAGVNVNTADDDGETPLMRACYRNQTNTVEVLLQNRANVAIVDNNGNSPLHFVAERGYGDLANKLFQHGASLELQNKNGFIPEVVAQMKGHKQLANHLAELRKQKHKEDKEEDEDYFNAPTPLPPMTPGTFELILEDDDVADLVESDIPDTDDSILPSTSGHFSQHDFAVSTPLPFSTLSSSSVNTGYNFAVPTHPAPRSGQASLSTQVKSKRNVQDLEPAVILDSTESRMIKKVKPMSMHGIRVLPAPPLGPNPSPRHPNLVTGHPNRLPEPVVVSGIHGSTQIVQPPMGQPPADDTAGIKELRQELENQKSKNAELKMQIKQLKECIKGCPRCTSLSQPTVDDSLKVSSEEGTHESVHDPKQTQDQQSQGKNQNSETLKLSSALSSKQKALAKKDEEIEKHKRTIASKGDTIASKKSKINEQKDTIISLYEKLLATDKVTDETDRKRLQGVYKTVSGLFSHSADYKLSKADYEMIPQLMEYVCSIYCHGISPQTGTGVFVGFMRSISPSQPLRIPVGTTVAVILTSYHLSSEWQKPGYTGLAVFDRFKRYDSGLRLDFSYLAGNKSLDYALLCVKAEHLLNRFKDCDLPVKKVYQDIPLEGSTMVLIGHPDDSYMQGDHIEVVDRARLIHENKDIQFAMNMGTNHGIKVGTNLHFLDYDNRIFYHCSSFHGASGAPCFRLYNEGNVQFVCIHSGGMYVKNDDPKKWEKSDFESGILANYISDHINSNLSKIHMQWVN